MPGPGRLERRLLAEVFDSDRGPIMDAGNEAVIPKILIENSRFVFGGQVGQDNI